jgi:hypothetical protein
MRRPRTLLALAALLVGTALGCGVTDDAESEQGSGETTDSVPEIDPASPPASPTTEVGPAGPATGDSTTTTEETTTTTEEPSTTTGDGGTGDDGGEDDAVCGPLRDVSDLDAQFSADLEAGGDWSVIQGQIVDGSGQLVDAYEEAIVVAPGDLVDELTTLRDFTEKFIGVARSSMSLEDFGTRVTEDPAAIEAGSAALTLDEFSQETCGFSTSNE